MNDEEEQSKADDAESIGAQEHDELEIESHGPEEEVDEDALINQIEEQSRKMQEHHQHQNEDEDDYGMDDSFSPDLEPWMIAERHEDEDEDEEEESDADDEEKQGDSSENEDVEYEWSSSEEEEEDVEVEEVIEEEDEDMILLKVDLVNNYLLKKALLKYLKKKNAYLQDRIYRTSVRKGLIKEEDMEHENKSKKPKKEKKFKRKGHDEGDEEEDEQIEGGQPEKDKKKHSEDWDDDAKSMKIKKIIEDAALTTQNLQAQLKEKTKLQKTYGETFTMEAKYQKVVNKIIRLLENVKLYEKHHIVNLEKHALRREEWHVAHKKQLMALLMRVQHASEEAKDSLSGKRMNPIDTQNFCTEMTYIHQKLCSTMIRMYKYRRGLELSLKRLDESEVQAEGLQMFEYEQLRSENQILKDRLNDRLKDVDNIKGKITHCLQILAHFRAKMFDITKLIEEGTAELEEINSNVYASRELTDKTARKFERLKLGEQQLLVESGLLDNAVLLRDFEKTHFDVVSQKDLKRKLSREYDAGLREIVEIKERIMEIQSDYPAVLSTPEELDRRRRSQERQGFLFLARDGATKCYIDPQEYPLEPAISPP